MWVERITGEGRYICKSLNHRLLWLKDSWVVCKMPLSSTQTFLAKKTLFQLQKCLPEMAIYEQSISYDRWGNIVWNSNQDERFEAFTGMQIAMRRTLQAGRTPGGMLLSNRVGSTWVDRVISGGIKEGSTPVMLKKETRPQLNSICDETNLERNF